MSRKALIGKYGRIQLRLSLAIGMLPSSPNLPRMDIIHLFRHSPSDGDALLSSLREDNNTSLAILDDIMEQIQEIEQQFNARLNVLRNNLKRHRRTAQALRHALHPEERPDSRAVFEGIPNMPDVDHA